jgi:Aldo/keto reductase family
MAMDRREFLGTGVGAAALTAAKNLAFTEAGLPGKTMSTLPKRPYKDGIELSILAMGGIVICGMPQEEASRRVSEAYGRGVNYFDCAPSYFNGEAETKLGEALRPYRKNVFLAEKTTKRNAQGAREELEQTLGRFHTDHVDLYQFHAVASMEDVDKILAPDGAAETFFAAKKEGKALGIFRAQRPGSDSFDGCAGAGQRIVSCECERMGERWIRAADPGEGEIEKDGAPGVEGADVREMAGEDARERPKISEMLV